MTIPMTAKASPSPVIGATAGTVTPSEIRDAYLSLSEAISDLEALRQGIHWEAIYPDLDSPEPEWEALQMAAQTVRDEATELRRLLAVLASDAPDQAEAFWAGVATAGIGRAA